MFKVGIGCTNPYQTRIFYNLYLVFALTVVKFRYSPAVVLLQVFFVLKIAESLLVYIYYIQEFIPDTNWQYLVFYILFTPLPAHSDKQFLFCEGHVGKMLLINCLLMSVLLFVLVELGLVCVGRSFGPQWYLPGTSYVFTPMRYL